MKYLLICPFSPNMHLQIYEEKMKTKHTNYFIFKKSTYLCIVKQGGLAQLARALAWHARGHEFDSRILHKRRQPFRLPFFVCGEWCYPPPKSPSCEGDLSLRSHNGIRGELVTSEALLFKGGFGWIVNITPTGCASIPEFDSRILHKRKGNQWLPFFVCHYALPTP